MCNNPPQQSVNSAESFFFTTSSDEGDEIVECDNCGITVHEGTCTDSLVMKVLLVVSKLYTCCGLKC